MINVFCIPEFETEFHKLCKNNSYKDIELNVREYFCVDDIQKVLSGIQINRGSEFPFIKKRISGRGGYRVYFLALVVENAIHLAFIHPKTGNLGYESISDDHKKIFLKRLIECVKSKDLFKLTCKEDKIVFQHLSEIK